MDYRSGLDVDLYLRKSRKDIEEERKKIGHGEQYDTLKRHRRQLLAIAKRENHNIIEIHEEVVSGESILERPKIQHLIRRIESGLIQGVLVVDLDRLGRGDMLDQGILDRAFRYSGALLLTPTETYNPSDESWELVFGVKSLVARQELKSITRRLQSGRRESANEGKSISKVPPYGYNRDENLRLHPDPDTSWVVKKMFQMMKDGHGRQTIANELDRLGISPPNHTRDHWSPSSITAIIKNEVYLGHIIWGKVKYTKRNGKYHKEKLPREKWNIKYNAHEPIVSEQLFQEANKAHTGRWRPSTVSSKTLSNPLAGILKCGYCGYSLLYQPKKERPNDYIRCSRPSCKGKQKSAAFPLVEERLLLVLKEYVRKFSFKENTETLQQNVIPIQEKALLKKKKEVTDLSLQKERLHDLLEQGVYTIETFIERQQNISERVKLLEDDISQIKSDIEKELNKQKNIYEFIPKVQSVLEAYINTDDAEKKNRLMKSILDKVTYVRKQDWKRRDQFELQIFTRI